MWPSRRKPATPQPALTTSATPTTTPSTTPAAAVDPEAVAAIARVIRRFLAAFHPAGRNGVAQLAASQNLWREVGSLTLLQLVTFVEQKFSITVRPIDFAPQNFASVAAIARFVAARQPRVASP